MTLAADVEQYVADALAAGRQLVSTAGTVATSPSQVSTDALTVVLDGSTVAVPAKQVRGFPLMPGMRVVLLLVGTEWVVVGSLSNPGLGTDMRLIVGAEIPDELKAFGVGVALLMFDTDKTSGLEVGYFFVGASNTLDGTANEKVMLFGKVKYPVPGDPESATTGDVKTAHQINMDGFTIFKDFPVQFWSTVPSVLFDTGVDVTMNDFLTVNNTTDLNGVLNSDNVCFFNEQVQLLGTDNFVMPGSNLWVQDGAGAFIDGAPILAGETHTQLVTFSALSSHTIVIAFDRTYDTIPNVHCNLNTGSAAGSRSWVVTAFAVSTTGFTMWIRDTNSVAQSWTNVPVQWTAVATS